MNLTQPLRRSQLVDRVTFIQKTVHNKSVLHFGCTDSPFHMDRYAAGNLLHQRLHEVCQSLKGIDIDRASIEWLRERESSWDMSYGDIECLSRSETDSVFDVVLVSEILEHLGNPVSALRDIRRFCNDDGVLLLTVPNAFSSRNFINTLLYREKVHSQHVCWFSPGTLTELLTRSGYTVSRIIPYITRIRKSVWLPYDLSHRLFQRIFNFLSEGIIAIACPDSEQD